MNNGDYKIQNSLLFEMLKIPSKRRFSSIKQFWIMEDKKIGCGSFGTVKLARHLSTCRMYAMKIINFKDLPSETEIRLIEREIKLHSELDHPHIIKLWDTLIDNDTIYMVMEFAEIGNLFYFQNTKNVFKEPEAFKYFCQTLNGIQYLHANDMIHRDLKPENLLLDSLNNIKICDFGWCAEDIKAKRTTFCGTYEYMAPEMLFKTDYDYHVDIWALGILLYELLHGCAPFKGKSVIEVQQEMLKTNYEIDKTLSEDVKDLITNILQFQPEKRLSIEEIYQHPWIKQMESSINNYLQAENIVFPKEIQQKLCHMPQNYLKTISKNKFQKKEQKIKHRKNNSLNFQDITNQNHININLQINNYASIKSKDYHKQYKNNNFHSQEKQIWKKSENIKVHQHLQNSHQKNQNSSSPYGKGFVMKKKVDGFFIKTQNNQNEDAIEKNRLKLISKNPTNKQLCKETIFLEKEKKKLLNSQISDISVNAASTMKKKYKFRKSQQNLHSDGHAIRFNTEANDKEEWSESLKFKKGAHSKNKLLLSSKNLLRMSKG